MNQKSTSEMNEERERPISLSAFQSLKVKLEKSFLSDLRVFEKEHKQMLKDMKLYRFLLKYDTLKEDAFSDFNKFAATEIDRKYEEIIQRKLWSLYVYFDDDAFSDFKKTHAIVMSYAEDKTFRDLN